jgi:hypothetical protein
MPDEDLHQRIKDIFRNFMTINPAGKASPLPTSDAAHAYWRIRFVHALEEMALRFGPHPNGINRIADGGLPFPRPDSQRAQAATQSIDARALSGMAILIKYGEYKYLKDTLSSGRIQVSPASTFTDPSHNRAIRDNELEIIHWMFEPTDDDLLPFAALPGFQAGEAVGTAALTRFTEDHYLFCMSCVFDPWVFDDFTDYDACLVIDDPRTFINRMMPAVHAALGSRGYAFAPVTYVDPVTQIDRATPIAFQKDARYRYQKEARGVWLPARHSGSLQKTLIDIGDLRDIARLIRISPI